jgi:hypothetical protein
VTNEGVALILYYDECERYACQALFWSARADAFATALRTGSGRDVVVDIYGNCTPPGAQTTPSGTRVTTTAAVPVELASAVDAHHRTLEKYRPMVRSIYKLLALSRTDVDFTLFWDLDVDFFPPHTLAHQPKRAVQTWLSALERMGRSSWVLAGRPDVSSPINRGMVLVRPDLRLYREALALLTSSSRRGGVFDRALGWGLAGAPRTTVPAVDPVWVHPVGSRAIRSNSWFYHGAMMDQGLWFYLTHARHHVYTFKMGDHINLPRRALYHDEMARAIRVFLVPPVAPLAAAGIPAETRLALSCIARSRKIAACAFRKHAGLMRTGGDATAAQRAQAAAESDFEAVSSHEGVHKPFEFVHGTNRSTFCAHIELDIIAFLRGPRGRR